MASNILIGSLIACKILVSDPLVQDISKEGNNKKISLNTNSTMSRLLDQNKNNVKVVKEQGPETEVIIEGTVKEIVEKEIWIKQENGKFKKGKNRFFKVKSEKIVDLLFIKEEACGLYDDIIESSSATVEKKEQEVVKKVKKDIVKKNTNNSEYEEEYMIVPIDQEIDKNYQEIKDPEVKKKINKALNTYLKNNNYKILSDEEKKIIADKKRKQKEILDRVAMRQKELFPSSKEESLPEENIEINNEKIASEKVKKESEVENKKEKDSSFFGESIIANFEDDLKEEKKIKDKVIEEKIASKKTIDKPKEISKKENDFSKIKLISKAFSFIIKEW